MATTTCTFATLFALDAERTREFYSCLGVVMHVEQHGNGPVHHSFTCPDIAVEIFPNASSSLSEFGALFGFKVPSLAAASGRLADFGARCVRTAERVGEMSRAVYIDPDGQAVFLYEE